MATVTKHLSATPVKPTHFLQRMSIYVLLAVVFFLLGFVPMWVSAREATERLETTTQSLTRVQMQAVLGAAVIDAQRGEYERALQELSTFYTSLQADLSSGEAAAFPPAAQAVLPPLLSERDEIIALLARGDPAAAARLSDLYQTFSQLVTGGAARAPQAGARGGREMILVKRVP